MKTTEKKLIGVIVLTSILSVCFIVSTFALATASIRMGKNAISTGRVGISLTETLLSGDEYRFEPGATIEKDLTVENTGTCDVWYKLYITSASGVLADVVDVTVASADGTLLYAGKMADLADRENTPVTDRSLAVGEKRLLKMTISYPEDAENEGQGSVLDFRFAVEAVQMIHNDEKEF